MELCIYWLWLGASSHRIVCMIGSCHVAPAPHSPYLERRGVLYSHWLRQCSTDMDHWGGGALRLVVVRSLRLPQRMCFICSNLSLAVTQYAPAKQGSGHFSLRLLLAVDFGLPPRIACWWSVLFSPCHASGNAVELGCSVVTVHCFIYFDLVSVTLQRNQIVLDSNAEWRKHLSLSEWDPVFQQ